MRSARAMCRVKTEERAAHKSIIADWCCTCGFFQCITKLVAYGQYYPAEGYGIKYDPAEGFGIKYEGSFLEKSQSGCVQNCCHFVCLHHFWA